MSGRSMQFDGNGVDFSPSDQAQQWLTQNGYSYGRMQGKDPRGILKGLQWDIQKWRNLSRADIAVLDGTMTGDMRNGPVFVWIKG